MIDKYLVKPGDTLNKIVEKRDLHINSILKENNINDFKLYKNQLVLIPLTEVNSIKLHEYKTKENDTLFSILNEFSISSKTLYYFNDIYNLILTENQELTINDDINVSLVFVNEYDDL